jgi:hypothetical protein
LLLGRRKPLQRPAAGQEQQRSHGPSPQLSV